ncbi:MAG: Recombination protein RecR [Parcubacteria group bacterium GW2011_GWC2_39_14]|nr:MAG: Recombination protein RecR [Parcubacteria group bacterium GW2011_GWC2_39_14]KKR54546.1 MAG: Recombination protein RecR [Parcubacteria group bacterium GW2011_GWA2_40_23]
MPRYPEKIENLINSFCSLPGIGRKTAERFVYFLLKQPKVSLINFAKDLTELHDHHFFCPDCYNFSENEGPCAICSNSTRDRSTICVVEDIQDLLSIENTGIFHGLYHVLGGKLDPIENVFAEDLTVSKLKDRTQKETVAEIILAISPDIQGEATIIYLRKLFQDSNIKITLLARGLPMGSDIEYTDEVTLGNALRGRQELK